RVDAVEPEGRADRADVRRVASRAAALAPAARELGPGVAEHRDEVIVNDDLPGERCPQLAHARLRDVSPDAQDVGEVEDLDGLRRRHSGCSMSAVQAPHWQAQWPWPQSMVPPRQGSRRARLMATSLVERRRGQKRARRRAYEPPRRATRIHSTVRAMPSSHETSGSYPSSRAARSLEKKKSFASAW